MKKENIFVEFLKKIHEKWFLSTVSLVNKTKNRLIIYITSIYNIIKSSIPPLFSQDSRISKECNPSTTWSNPAMEKNTYTPGGESRYTPLSKFNRLEKRRRVYRNYDFDRWSHWFKVAARYIKGLDKKRAYATSWTGLNPSALTTPCPSVIFNDHLCLPARKWL